MTSKGDQKGSKVDCSDEIHQVGRWCLLWLLVAEGLLANSLLRMQRAIMRVPVLLLLLLRVQLLHIMQRVLCQFHLQFL